MWLRDNPGCRAVFLFTAEVNALTYKSNHVLHICHRTPFVEYSADGKI
jgi:hypothetical protein